MPEVIYDFWCVFLNKHQKYLGVKYVLKKSGWFPPKCPIGVNENNEFFVKPTVPNLGEAKHTSNNFHLVHTWVKVVSDCYWIVNMLFQQMVAEGRLNVINVLPLYLFRLLALNSSWATVSCGTSCWVCLLCQLSSSPYYSSSVQKVPGIFTSS